jgi:hypothetical protein
VVTDATSGPSRDGVYVPRCETLCRSEADSLAHDALGTSEIGGSTCAPRTMV